MGQDSNWDINERVDEVFKNIVMPAFEALIKDYNGVDGYEVKIVSDGPIKKHETVINFGVLGFDGPRGPREDPEWPQDGPR